jgi:DNA sulfur modification protein DndD
MGMRLETIKLHNFGPYYGTQSLQFGSVRPIVLVHGANMRGKTSLLNSVRWVLYGHALNRQGKPMPIKSLVNFEAARNGDYTMSVELEFNVDQTQYVLRRAVQPRAQLAVPESDSDFTEILFLQRSGYQLNPDEAQTEINRILPEQTSRFFLFDGELLNDYEALLADSTKQAQLIKDSVEHILGVPAITNGIADMRMNLKDAAKRQQNLARKDHSAQVFASEAARLQAEIEAIEKDVAQLADQRDSRVRRQLELDEALRATSGIEADVKELQVARDRVARLKQEEGQLIQDKRSKLADAWRDLVQPQIKKRLQVEEADRDRQLGVVGRAAALRARISDLDRLDETGKCPTCGQSRHLEPEDLRKTRNAIENELALLHYDEAALARATESIRRLRQVAPAGLAMAISQIEERLIQIRVDLADLELRQDDLNHRLKGHDESAVARNRREYIEVTKELGVIEKSIEDKTRAIGQLQTDAARNRAMISKVSGPELQRVNREVQLYDDMIHLFESSLNILRDRLRKSVEKDASEIFLSLTTDKSYQGLRINDHYGLIIVDRSGNEVQVRSAGAEQVVALSLIGALNRNAIRRGPVIMDTPFGRLDPSHRENILTFVPHMAEQVTLLVHGGEVDRERDLAPIREQIDKEYRLDYVSSERTDLVLQKG